MTIKRSSLYVEPCPEVKKLIEKSISLLGSKKRFLETVKKYENVGYSNQVFYFWFKRNSWIPIEVVKTSCNILSLDLWEFLDNKKLRGVCGNPIEFRKKITPEMGMFFGWLLTDGTVSSGNQIMVFQSNLEVLEKLREITKTNFGINDKSIRITELSDKYGFKHSKKCYRLIISSHVFKEILIHYYGFLSGKKKKTRIPSCIVQSREDVKKAFLTGCLEGMEIYI